MMLQTLSPEEFTQFARMVYERAGIFLPEEKRGLLSSRLRARLKALAIGTFEEYHKRFTNADFAETELPFFLSAVTTNETYFFRNERLWELFEKTLVPEIVKANSRTKLVRVWSAASSSGEEAYTVAIILRETLPEFAKWRVQVIGTDISKKVLDRATRARYNEYAVSKMSSLRRKLWFDQVENDYQLKDEIRRQVKFQTHNLREPFQKESFDLVLLRNVLMYFDGPMKLKAVRHAGEAVAPGKYLFVGDVDPIRTSRELIDTLPLTPLSPGLYRKPAPGTSK